MFCLLQQREKCGRQNSEIWKDGQTKRPFSDFKFRINSSLNPACLFRPPFDFYLECSSSSFGLRLTSTWKVVERGNSHHTIHYNGRLSNRFIINIHCSSSRQGSCIHQPQGQALQIYIQQANFAIKNS